MEGGAADALRLESLGTTGGHGEVKRAKGLKGSSAQLLRLAAIGSVENRGSEGISHSLEE